MVSIIVPVYNAEKYIKRCIESLLIQTYQEMEILVIDDGSTDKTREIVECVATQYGCVSIIHKENEGSASARNFGLKIAQGEYIAFVDADDYVHPQYIESLISTLERTEADIVQCEYVNVPSKGDLFCQNTEKDDNTEVKAYSNIEFLKRFCDKSTYLETAVLWNKLYKKELFNCLEFPIGKGIDDEYLIYKIIYRAKKIVKIKRVLYYYYLSENSQMRSAPSLRSIDNVEAIEQQMIFLKSIGQTELANGLLYRYYVVLSRAYELVREHFPKEKYLLKELKNKKRNWKQALSKKEISIADKCILIIRINFPRMFDMLHNKLRGN